MIRAAALAALLAAPAAAQTPQCDARAALVTRLTTQFRELQRVVGQEQNGAIIEIWASQAGTWTALRSTPDGRSCIVAFGQSFSRLKAAFGEPL